MLWYVTDPELKEFVPPFRDMTHSQQSLVNDEAKKGPQTSTNAATESKDPNAHENSSPFAFHATII